MVIYKHQAYKQAEKLNIDTKDFSYMEHSKCMRTEIVSYEYNSEDNSIKYKKYQILH